MISHQEGSPQECWSILFTSIQFTSYFISKSPDAIMIPSGISAKVAAVYSCNAYAIAQKACSPDGAL